MQKRNTSNHILHYSTYLKYEKKMRNALKNIAITIGLLYVGKYF